MTGNRKPTKPQGRLDPENPGARPEDEEDEQGGGAGGVGDDSDENDTGTSAGSASTPGTPIDTPPGSPLTNEIRRVRAANQQLQSQLAGYEPQIAAAKSMHLQFTEAVDTIQACMSNIKQNMSAMQQAQFSSWAENRMSEITQERPSEMEPKASTSTGSGTGYDFERDEEEFRTIKDRFDKLKRLIAIREQAEAGGSIEFTEAIRNEIAELACRGEASGSGAGDNVADGAGVPDEGAAEGKVVEEESSATSKPGDECKSEEDENGGGH